MYKYYVCMCLPTNIDFPIRAFLDYFILLASDPPPLRSTYSDKIFLMKLIVPLAVAGRLQVDGRSVVLPRAIARYSLRSKHHDSDR